MKMMEVRCCCQPDKLLGWLPVPDDMEERGVGSVRFSVRRDGYITTGSALTYPGVAPVYVPPDIIELPVARFVPMPEEWRGYLALKSEETPIERLRLIPGFQENTR